ncbi:MAG: TIGR03557 family F420-dependent LLM class oxidoreductase [Acidobacteria bacterium]|nr:TIGR03557 family F420-dependent LLM class oxidoreductase [Acidobacteriota bacterium]
MASTEPEIDLGYWLSSEEHGPGALVANAIAAEAAGFRAAMVSDHAQPWTPHQGQAPFVWAVLGAVAVCTHDLRLATGVTSPGRLHPFAVAQAAATVEILAPGRFTLGLGTGERLNEQLLGQRWRPPGERRAALAEAIGVIRRLLAGETVDHDGHHFRLEHARLWSRPDTAPPIVVAAGGTTSAALAAELADGVVIAAPVPDVVDAYRAAGGRGPRLGQLHVCWAGDEGEARRTAARWWPIAALPPAVLGELARPEEFAALAGGVSESDVATHVVCGPDPERHLAAVARYVGAGCTTVYLHQVGPDQAGFLDFCRRELLPRFAR